MNLSTTLNHITFLLLVTFPHSLPLLIALESISQLKLQSCTAVSENSKISPIDENSLNAIPTQSDSSKVYVSIPANSKACLSLSTIKNESGLELTSNVAQYRSTMFFEWWREGTDPVKDGACRVTFKGFQAIYRLSPDLGHYRRCNRDLSTHRHWLAQQLPARTQPGITQLRCPIAQLPTTYRDYIQCHLLPNQWYILRSTSTALVEYQRSDSTLETASHNQSELAIFYTGLTVTSGIGDWMGLLVKMDIRCQACQCRLLIQKHPSWSSILYLDLFYAYNNQPISDMRWIANTTLSREQPWKQLLVTVKVDNFDYDIYNGTNDSEEVRLCARYSNTRDKQYFKGRQCIVVQTGDCFAGGSKICRAWVVWIVLGLLVSKCRLF